MVHMIWVKLFNQRIYTEKLNDKKLVCVFALGTQATMHSVT